MPGEIQKSRRVAVSVGVLVRSESKEHPARPVGSCSTCESERRVNIKRDVAGLAHEAHRRSLAGRLQLLDESELAQRGSAEVRLADCAVGPVAGNISPSSGCAAA
jgi:hypothetical protein